MLNNMSIWTITTAGTLDAIGFKSFGDDGFCIDHFSMNLKKVKVESHKTLAPLSGIWKRH
jgi:hypothetical protein